MRSTFLVAIHNPNVALAFIAVGILLIAAECVRPGKVVFLSFGSVLATLGVFGFSGHLLNRGALLGLALGSALLVYAAIRPTSLIVAGASVVLITIAGMATLPQLNLMWSAAVLTIVSVSMLILLRLAALARRIKHVASIEGELKGSCQDSTIGVSSTLAGYFVLG